MHASRSVLLGESIFTSMRSIKGVVPRLEDHLLRVFHSCNQYFFNHRLSYDQFIKFYFSHGRLEKLIQAYPDHYFRLTFFSNSKTPLFKYGLSDIDLNIQYKKVGLSLGAKSLMSSESPFSQNYHPIKSGSYFQHMLARSNAIDQGYEEALFCDGKRITEAATSNIVFKMGDHFITPAHPSILKGIGLKIFKDFLEKRGMDLVEREVYKKELRSLKQPFLVNSVQLLTAIDRIDNFHYDISESSLLRTQFLESLGLK